MGHRQRKRQRTQGKIRLLAQSGRVLLVTNVPDDSSSKDLVDQLHVQEIAQQCRFALKAIGDAAAAVGQLERAKVAERARAAERADDLLWYSVQQLFVAVGNVSKSLLGTAARGSARAPAAVRAERLCRALGVDPSEGWLDRSIRDSFEHFDERLDRLYQVGAAVVYDRTIVLHDATEPFVFGPEYLHMKWRTYDVQAQTASFSDVTINLVDLRDALTSLLDATAPLLAQTIESAGAVSAFIPDRTVPENVAGVTLNLRNLQGQPIRATRFAAGEPRQKADPTTQGV